MRKHEFQWVALQDQDVPYLMTSQSAADLRERAREVLDPRFTGESYDDYPACLGNNAGWLDEFFESKYGTEFVLKRRELRDYYGNLHRTSCDVGPGRGYQEPQFPKLPELRDGYSKDQCLAFASW